MMKNITWHYLPFIVLFAFTVGCKSKKKVADITTSPDKTTTPEVVEKTEENPPVMEDTKTEMEAKERSVEEKLTEYFTAISNAPSPTSANNSIEEALNLFSSPDALVLIVIGEFDGEKDYDKPTTIQKYLNYLKDQKKPFDAISAMKKDASGKITELELKK